MPRTAISPFASRSGSELGAGRAAVARAGFGVTVAFGATVGFVATAGFDLGVGVGAVFGLGAVFGVGMLFVGVFIGTGSEAIAWPQFGELYVGTLSRKLRAPEPSTFATQSSHKASDPHVEGVVVEVMDSNAI